MYVNIIILAEFVMMIVLAVRLSSPMDMQWTIFTKVAARHVQPMCTYVAFLLYIALAIYLKDVHPLEVAAQAAALAALVFLSLTYAFNDLYQKEYPSWISHWQAFNKVVYTSVSLITCVLAYLSIFLISACALYILVVPLSSYLRTIAHG